MPARAVPGFDGERLRELREWRGVSRIELARATGASYSAITNYENGYTTPSVPVFLAIARHLRIKRSELISDEAA